jgi:hypothetical protein
MQAACQLACAVACALKRQDELGAHDRNPSHRNRGTRVDVLMTMLFVNRPNPCLVSAIQRTCQSLGNEAH